MEDRDTNIATLDLYVSYTAETSTFDFPAYYTLQSVCNDTSGTVSISDLADPDLVYAAHNPAKAVTFCANHDADLITSDMMLAYAFILTDYCVRGIALLGRPVLLMSFPDTVKHFHLPACRSGQSRLLVALLMSLPFAVTLPAQSTGYVFTKIIDDETVRPDGMGEFYIGSVDAYPSLDANTVLFQDITNGANSLWSANSSGGGQGLVKIADFQTAVPGGVGTFTRFDDQTARVQDGVILFEGLDSNTTAQTHGGLYTVPAGGGTISKLIDYHTTAPESGFLFVQPNANNQITDGPADGDYDLENGIVAFHAITDGDANHDNADGIYTIHLDGTGITLLANRSNDATPAPFPVNQYFSVVLHGGTAVFYGATVFAPYGIFSSPQTGGLDAPAELATPYTPLPGGQSPEMSTVYYTGFDHFDHVTGSLVFAAHDGSGINGLYRLPADGLGSGVFTTVVDNHTSLPGSAAPPDSLDGAPFSADGGQVAFLTPGSASALYVANADGSFTRVVGVGDVFDGITLTSVDFGAHALSGGRIAFGVGSYLGGHDGNARYGAIFVATPVEQTANLALTMNASTGTLTVGQQVSFTLTVVNDGPAALPSASLVDTLPAGLSFVSASNAVNSSNGVTFNVGALAVGASASFNLVAQATAAGTLMNTASVAGAVPDADTTNNTAQTVVTAAAVPTVTIAATGSREADEGGPAGKAVVRRTGDVSAALTVRYKARGSAKAGKDFKPLSGTVTIPAGAAQAKLKIKAIDNTTIDGKRVVKITLLPSPDASYQLGSPDLAKIGIIDND